MNSLVYVCSQNSLPGLDSEEIELYEIFRREIIPSSEISISSSKNQCQLDIETSEENNCEIMRQTKDALDEVAKEMQMKAKYLTAAKSEASSNLTIRREVVQSTTVRAGSQEESCDPPTIQTLLNSFSGKKLTPIERKYIITESRNLYKIYNNMQENLKLLIKETAKNIGSMVKYNASLKLNPTKGEEPEWVRSGHSFTISKPNEKKETQPDTVTSELSLNTIEGYGAQEETHKLPSKITLFRYTSEDDDNQKTGRRVFENIRSEFLEELQNNSLIMKEEIYSTVSGEDIREILVEKPKTVKSKVNKSDVQQGKRNATSKGKTVQHEKTNEAENDEDSKAIIIPLQELPKFFKLPGFSAAVVCNENNVKDLMIQMGENFESTQSNGHISEHKSRKRHEVREHDVSSNNFKTFPKLDKIEYLNGKIPNEGQKQFFKPPNGYEIKLVDSQGETTQLYTTLGYPVTDLDGYLLKDSCGDFLVNIDQYGVPFSCTNNDPLFIEDGKPWIDVKHKYEAIHQTSKKKEAELNERKKKFIENLLEQKISKIPQISPSFEVGKPDNALELNSGSSTCSAKLKSPVLLNDKSTYTEESSPGSSACLTKPKRPLRLNGKSTNTEELGPGSSTFSAKHKHPLLPNDSNSRKVTELSPGSFTFSAKHKPPLLPNDSNSRKVTELYHESSTFPSKHKHPLLPNDSNYRKMMELNPGSYTFPSKHKHPLLPNDSDPRKAIELSPGSPTFSAKHKHSLLPNDSDPRKAIELSPGSTTFSAKHKHSLLPNDSDPRKAIELSPGSPTFSAKHKHSWLPNDSDPRKAIDLSPGSSTFSAKHKHPLLPNDRDLRKAIELSPGSSTFSTKHKHPLLPNDMSGNAMEIIPGSSTFSAKHKHPLLPNDMSGNAKEISPGSSTFSAKHKHPLLPNDMSGNAMEISPGSSTFSTKNKHPLLLNDMSGNAIDISTGSSSTFSATLELSGGTIVPSIIVEPNAEETNTSSHDLTRGNVSEMGLSKISEYSLLEKEMKITGNNFSIMNTSQIIQMREQNTETFLKSHSLERTQSQINFVQEYEGKGTQSPIEIVSHTYTRHSASPRMFLSDEPHHMSDIRKLTITESDTENSVSTQTHVNTEPQTYPFDVLNSIFSNPHSSFTSIIDSNSQIKQSTSNKSYQTIESTNPSENSDAFQESWDLTREHLSEMDQNHSLLYEPLPTAPSIELSQSLELHHLDQYNYNRNRLSHTSVQFPRVSNFRSY